MTVAEPDSEHPETNWGEGRETVREPAATEVPDLEERLGAVRPPPRPREAATEVAEEPEPESPALEAAGPEPPPEHKVGIIGGRSVGKSYLFQAMVHRTQSGTKAGALSTFLHGRAVRLQTALVGKNGERGPARPLTVPEFIANYEFWERIEPTQRESQRWYRLRLPFPTGVLGRGTSNVDVEFFDGSGEGFFEVRTPEHRHLWEEAYADVRVIVFCLPLWAAFPAPNLGLALLQERRKVLDSFEAVVSNYSEMRDDLKLTAPVQSIIGLTMADDKRGALRTLFDHWIAPYMTQPKRYLKQLRSGAGVVQYLRNARQISEALHREFEEANEARVSRIPELVTFTAQRPWIIPLSAIDGAQLDEFEQRGADPAAMEERHLTNPVPVHAELPLLIALCDRFNALM